jgi:hypothetical protein
MYSLIRRRLHYQESLLGSLHPSQRVIEEYKQCIERYLIRLSFFAPIYLLPPCNFIEPCLYESFV